MLHTANCDKVEGALKDPSRSVKGRTIPYSYMLSVAVPLGILFYGYIYCTAINYVVWNGEARPFTIAFYLLLFGCALFLGLARASCKIVFCSSDIIVASLFVYMVFRDIAANGFSRNLAFLTLGIALPYCCARVLAAQEIRQFLVALFLSGFGVFIIALLCLPSVWESWQTEGARPLLFGSRANTVIIAQGVGCFLINVFAYALRPMFNRRKRLFMLAVVPISMLILVAFSGKTALIAAGAIGFVLVTVASWAARGVRFVFLFLFIGSAIASVLFAPDNLIHFYKLADLTGMVESLSVPVSTNNENTPLDDSSNFGVDDNNSMAVRIIAIRNAAALFRETPLVGYGTGKLMKPHSTIVQMLFEYGCFAGLAFLFLFVRVAWRLTRMSFDHASPLRPYAWILMAVYVYTFVNDQLLGSVFNLCPFILLTGTAVSLVHGSKAR